MLLYCLLLLSFLQGDGSGGYAAHLAQSPMGTSADGRHRLGSKGHNLSESSTPRSAVGAIQAMVGSQGFEVGHGVAAGSTQHEQEQYNQQFDDYGGELASSSGGEEEEVQGLRLAEEVGAGEEGGGQARPVKRYGFRFLM